MLPRGPRRGQVNFRSHNSCVPLGASSPGRRRACVLFGVSFRGGYSPTGLPGDTAWIAFPPTGRGRLGVLSHRAEPRPASRDAGRVVDSASSEAAANAATLTGTLLTAHEERCCLSLPVRSLCLVTARGYGAWLLRVAVIGSRSGLASDLAHPFCLL